MTDTDADIGAMPDGPGCQPTASAPDGSSQSGIPIAIPDGLVWTYEAIIRNGYLSHQWSLKGPRGGIHVSANWTETPGWRGTSWWGGIEGHSPIRREYEGEQPSHENCWLIDGPCWHDGSSLQFSEQIAPYLPSRNRQMEDREHKDVLGIMLNRYHSWLPEAAEIEAAQAIEARSGETGTGSTEGESAVPEGNAP